MCVDGHGCVLVGMGVGIYACLCTRASVWRCPDVYKLTLTCCSGIRHGGCIHWKRKRGCVLLEHCVCSNNFKFRYFVYQHNICHDVLLI